MVVTMPTKFERNWDMGKDVERARKHCVQKPRDLVHVCHCNEDRSGGQKRELDMPP